MTAPDAQVDIASGLFDELAAAWNAADGAAFGAHFADDASFVTIRGEHHEGDGAAIGRAHQAIFDTIYAGSAVRFDVESVRPLAPGLLHAVVRSTLDAPTGPIAGTNHSRITALLAEDGADDRRRWVVRSFHNTLEPVAVAYGAERGAAHR